MSPTELYQSTEGWINIGAVWSVGRRRRKFVKREPASRHLGRFVEGGMPDIPFTILP
jgi:hypothetical protein